MYSFCWFLQASDDGMQQLGCFNFLTYPSPSEAEDFSSNLCVQAGSGAHPASYTMGTGGSFTRGKARPGRDADHSPPSSAEVKKE
jgi:hypothetical protein